MFSAVFFVDEVIVSFQSEKFLRVVLSFLCLVGRKITGRSISLSPSSCSLIITLSPYTPFLLCAGMWKSRIKFALY